MSGKRADQPETPGEPSMEDILASIRRILTEDQTMPGTTISPEPFALTEAMLVSPPHDILADVPVVAEEASSPTPAPNASEAPSGAPQNPTSGENSDLLAPAVAAAAAASVGSLLRAVSQDRHAAVRSGGGPTIEDVVRAELSPLLKDWLSEHAEPVAERLVREELRLMLREWLNVHLPPIVERAVRSEIERVVSRGLT
jgi:cell pole-organizing protein PopZ